MGIASIPSYDGIAMFSVVHSMRTGEPERETQTAAFFGINGIGSIGGGSRGRKTVVQGRLECDDLGSYNAAEQLFYNYLNVGNFTLNDTQGRSWGNVRMVAFSPEDAPLKVDIVTGQVINGYSATFQHMI